MYINITDSETADNKGSSSALVHYLDKENRTNLDNPPEHWFNQHLNNIPSHEARIALDHNIAKLSKTDAKFFLINISPSQKEIAFLKEKYGQEGAKEQLKAYAIHVMDEYARNFKRPGIERSKNLLWFGKLENYRYYSYKDPEVKKGIRKRGERKEGEQMHLQVIVSRKDITNTIKLSPMNKSRGKNTEHSKKMGQFDRSAFKASGEVVFDTLFGLERGLTETFRYANAQKKGNLEQRMAIYAEKRNLQDSKKSRPSAMPPQTTDQKTYLKTPELTNFLSGLLDKTSPDYGPGIPRKRKKKKKKNVSVQQQSI